MKIKLLTLSAVATFLFACGGGTSPDEVAKNFHEAITAQDWSTAKDLATTKGKEQVDAAKQMAESMGALGGEKPAKPEIESVKCDEPKDNKTTCTCKEKGGKETKYELEKEGDKWAVNYNKLGAGGDIAPEGEEMMEEVETEVDEAVEDVEGAVEEVVEGE